MDNGMEYQNVRAYHAGLLQDAEKRLKSAKRGIPVITFKGS